MVNGSVVAISFVGRSKVGKTTLIERLIPLLTEKGLRIGVIKHHHNDFEIDKPGKDTYRYKRAGAKFAMLASPGKVALVEDTPVELTLEEIVARFVHGVDLLIVEGFKKEALPKIEVFLTKEGADGPVCAGDKNLVAVVTDESLATTLPVFSRDDIEGVVRFILTRFIETRPS
ncbi:MAG: Molybdopterin-guanine dinucleotide biosynthesis adapter protein [Syntrophorhabdus sp. PtaU1.Bin050]|nr:MAG: Molybdopterin-guanine dinucleotide biosynthesis adapter protein [Syntrophorhabdus sp. PtaU1.Bin050]